MQVVRRIAFCWLALFALVSPALAQDSPYSASGDVATVSKYIWRGQRLTNDWSVQPSATFGAAGLSFNIWGNMDLTAVNEGDSLFLTENPAAPAGNHNGLQGKFSEVDYTFSFAQSFDGASVDIGAIVYTFPERSATLGATTEIYGGLTFDNVPLAPSATIYLDVDETRAGGGSTGAYFLLSASHSLPLSHPLLGGLDLSASLGFANSGFGSFYYGEKKGGAHDTSVTVALPFSLGETWSASAFVTYSGLIGDFRKYQFQDPRDVHRGTAGLPASYADTVWGGFSLSLNF